jgi:hypothetical protein
MGGYVIFKSDIADYTTELSSIADEDKDEWIKQRVARKKRISIDASGREREEQCEKNSAKDDYFNKVQKMVEEHGWKDEILMRVQD